MRRERRSISAAVRSIDDRRALAPAGQVADGELARLDAARRAHAAGDQLLRGLVELGVVVLAVGADERVYELVQSVLTCRLTGCETRTTIALVLGR
jgi:uncharacterized protein (DUF58 family)